MLDQKKTTGTWGVNNIIATVIIFNDLPYSFDLFLRYIVQAGLAQVLLIPLNIYMMDKREREIGKDI